MAKTMVRLVEYAGKIGRDAGNLPARRQYRPEAGNGLGIPQDNVGDLREVLERGQQNARVRMGEPEDRGFHGEENRSDGFQFGK